METFCIKQIFFEKNIDNADPTQEISMSRQDFILIHAVL